MPVWCAWMCAHYSLTVMAGLCCWVGVLSGVSPHTSGLVLMLIISWAILVVSSSMVKLSNNFVRASFTTWKNKQTNLLTGQGGKGAFTSTPSKTSTLLIHCESAIHCYCLPQKYFWTLVMWIYLRQIPWSMHMLWCTWYSYLLWAFYVQSREKCDEVTVHALEAPVPEQPIHTGLLHQLTVVIQTIVQQLQKKKKTVLLQC